MGTAETIEEIELALVEVVVVDVDDSAAVHDEIDCEADDDRPNEDDVELTRVVDGVLELCRRRRRVGPVAYV